MSISLSGNLVDGQDGGNMEMSSHKSDDRLARKRNAKTASSRIYFQTRTEIMETGECVRTKISQVQLSMFVVATRCLNRPVPNNTGQLKCPRPRHAQEFSSRTQAPKWTTRTLADGIPSRVQIPLQLEGNRVLPAWNPSRRASSAVVLR